MFWEFVFHISSRTDFIHGIPIRALVGAPCHGYSLNCHFGHARNPSITYEKAKCVCFIYMQ